MKRYIISTILVAVLFVYFYFFPDQINPFLFISSLAVVAIASIVGNVKSGLFALIACSLMLFLFPAVPEYNYFIGRYVGFIVTGLLMLYAQLQREKISLELTTSCEDFKSASESVVEAQQEYAQLAAIVESSNDSIISEDTDGKILSWNKGAELLFGYTSDEAVGHNISIIFPSDLIHEEASLLQKIRSGENVQHFKTSRRRKDGSLVDVSLTASPILDSEGNIVGISKITRDVSEEKRYVEEIENSKRLADLAAKEKDRFLASLSHELRTPLVSVLGYSNMLSTDSLSPEESKVAIETIRKNAQLQVDLIEDLLDVSRIMTGKFSISRTVFSVREATETAINTLMPQAKEKGIPILSEIDDITLFADKKRYSQIILNLISNAIKFTEKGTINIKVSRGGENAVLQVSDTGTGISKENINKIFTEFMQLDSSPTRSFSGLGLGLSIVKSLVEAHGGVVGVESIVGEGSTFTVKIPVFLEYVGKREDERPDVNLGGLRIFILEDNTDTSAYLKTFYGQHGGDVMTAASGEEGRKIVSEESFDIMLIDIALPHESGDEFLTKLREAGNTTPAIALTAYSILDKDQDMFDGYLRKPATEAELLGIRRYLRDSNSGKADLLDIKK